MFHKMLLLIFALTFTFPVLPQAITEALKSEDAEKLEKQAVDFLRETQADINSMRTVENRVSFTSELASLMWFHDEREARAMYVGVIGDFKQLILQYDSQMNLYGIKPSDESDGGEIFFMGEPTERAIIERKFRTAMAVRQQISLSIAEHDAELAYSFYYDSLSAISNPEFRKQMENRDSYFEFQLINQIADKNAAKAAQFGKKSLEKGFNYQHLELLKKIYAKDVDKGVEFAADILSRVKSEKLNPDKFWVVSSLLNFGSETLEKSRIEGGKKAIYSQSDLRDLAEIFAQAILSQSGGDYSAGLQFAEQIDKYVPGRGAQIRAKFRGRMSNSNARYSSNTAPAVGEAAGAMNTSANAAYTSSKVANSNSNTMSPPERERQEREQNEKRMMEDVMKLGSKQLPKDQRDSIIAQARKILMLAQGREKKITGLSMLAAQVARAGDKELAAEIMKDAQALVNPQPKNYRDFMLTWMLATGYASSDPDKAFPLLEDTISRANDTLAAFIKVGEFIDVAEEMVVDGELQVGAFGGSMVRGMTKELGMADSTIRVLAKADFDKTKNLTNRFDRPEVRILAKMMVLRAVLGDKGEPESGVDSESVSEPLPPPPRRRPN